MSNSQVYIATDSDKQNISTRHWPTSLFLFLQNEPMALAHEKAKHQNGYNSHIARSWHESQIHGECLVRF